MMNFNFEYKPPKFDFPEIKVRKEQLSTTDAETVKAKPSEISHEKFSLGKFLLDLGIDLAVFAAGEVVGGGVGGFAASALRAGKIMQNIERIRKALTTGGRFIGGTASYSGLEIARGKEPEEAVTGALVAQVGGIAIGKAVSPAVKALGKSKVVKSAWDKSAELLHKAVFSESVPRESFKKIVSSLTPEQMTTAVLTKNAEKEVSQLIKKEEDWNKILSVTKGLLNDTKVVEDELIDNVINTLSKIDRQSAHPVIAIEFIKFAERAYPEHFTKYSKIISELEKKYPVLFKKHEFIKFSDASIRELMIDGLKEYDELVKNFGGLTAFIKKLTDDLKTVLDKKVYLEELPKEEVSKITKRISSLRDHLEGSIRFFDTEGKDAIRKILKNLNSAEKFLKTTSRSQLRYIESLKNTIKDTIDKQLSIIETLSSTREIVSTLPKVIVSKINKISNILNEIKNATAKLKDVSDISNVKTLLKEAKQEAKELKHIKEFKAISSNLSKIENKLNVKKLSKVLLRKHPVEKSLEKVKSKLSSIPAFLSMITPKNIRNIIENTHYIYYPRTAMPAKIIKRETEPVEALTEYELESQLHHFYKTFAEAFNALKARKYPLLLLKYKDELAQGINIGFKTSSQNLITTITRTYMLAPVFTKVKRILSEMVDKDTILFKPKGYDIEVAIPLVTKNIEKLGYNLPTLYKQLTIGSDTFYVYRPLVEILDRAINLATGASFSIFGKGAFGALTTFNTLLKRTAVLFSLIHMKALTTAGIGIGRGKDVIRAWWAFFNKNYVEEVINPMAKETAELMMKHNLQTNFIIRSFDDVRTQLEMRLSTGKLKEILEKPTVKFFAKGLKPILDITAEFDKALWDRMFYTLKIGFAREIVEQLEKGAITRDVATSYFNKLGSVYGGNWEWFYMKQETRELIRLLLFAPDWYLTLIRHYTGSISGHELFGDFFRKIFIIHYIIANELNWSINGKTTWDNFVETKNWKDLFRVPLYTKDVKTGQWKASYISPLGFEIEGIELLGTLFVFDAFTEYMFTNKSAIQTSFETLKKWKNYIASKQSSVLRFYTDFVSQMSSEGLDFVLRFIPAPIMVNMFGKIVNRYTTLSEAGIRLPSEFIFLMHQFGIKYHANETISQKLLNELTLKTDRKTAEEIIKRYNKEFHNITSQVRKSYNKLGYKLKSDNPELMFKNAIKYSIYKHIKYNYASDIKSSMKNKSNLREIKRKIYHDFDGTVLSYYPQYRDLIDKVFERYVKLYAKGEAIEKTGQ